MDSNMQAEEALRASEEKFRAAFTISPDSISITRLADGRYIDVNDGFLDTTGYSREEVVGKTAFDINIWDHPEDRLKLTGTLKTQGHVTNFEATFVMKGGRKMTGLMSARIFDIQGVPHLLAFTRDISDRKKFEEELRQAEYRFRALIENAPDGIALVGSDGFFKYISPSAKKIFSYTEDDPITISADELTHPDDLPMVHQNIGHMFADPSFIPVLQYRFRSKDGTWRWIESIFTNLLAKPSVEAIVINFRDITDQRKSDEKIKSLNHSLEKRVEKRTAELIAANKELEAFAYTVSHDLRAPVRAIGGFTRILQEDFIPQLDAEGQRVFRVILENTHKMEQLIDDLLSFSRLSRADMNLSTVNMTEIVWKCFTDLAQAEERQRIILTVADFPLIKGDYPMLVQVWTNLLSNAIKYTSQCESPKILIETTRQGKDFVFSITDNGTGFDMKFVDKLFGVFQRLHSEKEFEGTGVGLAIVQRIIHRHGGRVWAEGAVNKGAKFSFTLAPEESPPSTRI